MIEITTHYGIVLKKYTQNTMKKIRLLDNKLGSLDVYLDILEPMEGVLIKYELQKKRMLMIMVGHEIIALPKPLIAGHIVFIHHVLEICYFFMPIHTNCPNVFFLLQHLYLSSCCDNIKNQLIFLFKLIIAIGIYKSAPILNDPSIININNTNIPTAFNIELNVTQLQDIKNWLYLCLKNHPYVDCFKTMTFFSESTL